MGLATAKELQMWLAMLTLQGLHSSAFCPVYYKHKQKWLHQAANRKSCPT